MAKAHMILCVRWAKKTKTCSHFYPIYYAFFFYKPINNILVHHWLRLQKPTNHMSHSKLHTLINLLPRLTMPCDHLPIIETFYYFLGFLTYLNAELLIILSFFLLTFVKFFFCCKKKFCFLFKTRKFNNHIYLAIFMSVFLFSNTDIRKKEIPYISNNDSRL